MIKMKNSTIIYGSIFAIFVVARTAAVIGAGALLQCGSRLSVWWS